MAGITQERAREIITEIFNQSGGFLTDDEQQGVLANVLGAPVREAAARAWTSDTRFVYEMIQNAEDCSYNSVKSKNAIPSLRFYVFSDRIVVDSNEDGFEESHVRAICSAGKRKKEGKLGEKGIGFKSVFKIASKARIQSGPFCFSLQHRDGENGLGMIAPVNEIHELLPDGVRTRFTLFSRPEKCREIQDELLSLPHTIIAFLSRLHMLSFWLSRSSTSLMFSRPTIGPSLVCVETRLSTVMVHRYIPFRIKVTGLPPRESRQLIEDVEVVLAFPQDGRALTTQPFAHSYRPLRGAGLNFLIQSDFVTQDNGEDLAACPWNDHLLDSLPGVFFAALQEFCSIPEFEKIWPQFLPDDKIKGSPWSPFYERLLRDLKHIPVFKTRRGTLKSLEEVRYLLPEHCGSNGEPLLEDLQEDIYLSPQYADYYGLLEPFGLQPVSSRQLLDRLRPYLENPQPRLLMDTFSKTSIFMKRFHENWHSKVAELLLSWLNCSQDDVVAKQIEHLQIVPVNRGCKSIVLKSPKDSAIYFPHDTSGNLIPSGVVDVVPVSEVVDVARVRLYTRLGVKPAEPSFVIERICDWNMRAAERPSLEESICNLRYVYAAAPSRSAISAKCIFLYDSDGKELEMPQYGAREWKRAEDLYFKNNDGYGMDAVVQVLQRRCPPLVDLHYHKFLHPAYTAGYLSNDPWMKWLEGVGSIRQAPRLETPGPAPRPSKLLRLVVRYAPDILISMLKDNWNVYAMELASVGPSTLSEIMNASVPVDCGTEPLERSFLGTPERRSLWSGTYLKDEFPFLKIPSGRENDDLKDWDFLARFGVGKTMAEFLVGSAKRLSMMPLSHARDGFFKLYELLADNYYDGFWCVLKLLCLVYANPVKRDSPTPPAIVYLPQPGSDGKLVRLADCVWDDNFPCGKHVLGSYKQYLQNPKVKQMFQKVLSCRNEDYAAFFSKLSWLRGQNGISQDSVCRIYKEIVEGSWSEQDWETIR